MTQKSFFILYLLTVSFVLRGQTVSDSLTSASIDSVINHIRSDKTKLILTKTGGLIIDSALFKKVSYTPNKKKVKITFADYTSITVKADDFWGLVTDFGQCQRFYNGETYIVWHTKAPYIYRDYAASDRKIKYFYSKTLLSEVIPLTKENIYEIADAKTIEQLQAYLKTHDIEKSKDGGPNLPAEVHFFEDAEWFTPSDFFMFHAQIAWAILEILMCKNK
ncbi:MAG: hypothetical protein JWM14_903 [Chitinophagaceae bacterium]|nr:hypothetical protein [Chitinophagaceae bacterium]